MDDRVELRATVGTPIVVGLFAVLMVLAAAAIPYVEAQLLFGALALLFGWVAIAYARRRLTIAPDGITCKGLITTKHLGWDEIDHYKYWSQDQTYAYAAGVQGGLIGVLVVALVAGAVARSRKKKGQEHARFSMGALKLVGTDGKRISIDPQFKDVARALQRIFPEVHRRLRARGALDFAPFKLGAAEVEHDRKGTLALAEIEKVVANGSGFAVHKRGKRLAWARAGMARIKNSLLLCELLGERGLIVEPSAGMFVPVATLATLREASSRHAALPAARVVSR